MPPDLAGLYHAALSRMGRLLRNAHAAAASLPSQQQNQSSSADGNPSAATAGAVAQANGNKSSSSSSRGDWSHIPLPPLPPVYENCSVLIREEDGRRCRDLYVEVILTDLTEPGHAEEARGKLEEACKLNPHVVSIADDNQVACLPDIHVAVHGVGGSTSTSP